MHQQVLTPRLRMMDRVLLLSRGSAPRLVVTAGVIVGLLLHVRFLLYTDPHQLAVGIQDDSYYYLQPAWMFTTTGMFTVDGHTPTYGFQPLWMLVLTAVASVSPDTVAFLRAALIAGAFFFWATGLLLQRLGERWTTGWCTLMAPALWLLNPSLRGISTTGKENALYAFLLVAAVLCAYAIGNAAARRASFAMYGCLCGLLVLSRVNSLVFVALMLLALYRAGETSARERQVRLACAIGGLLVVVLPWVIYAHFALGGLFPNSGTAKLIGARAALILYVHDVAPWLPMDWLAATLPLEERVFLNAPDALVKPSLSSVSQYAIAFLGKLSLGSWLERAVAALWGTRAGLLWGSQILALGGLVVLLLYRAAIGARALATNRRRVVTTLRRHLPLVLLFVFAAWNTLVNGFLLPVHIYYATWYAVPETLAYVLLASFAGALGFAGARRAFGRPWVSGLLAFLLLAAPTYIAIRGLTPRVYRHGGGSLQEVWEARPWILDHVPANARIGAMSSGLLGYLLINDRTVVNLDGLANSPDFVRRIWRSHMLYASGLAAEDPLWAYVREQRIEYIANAEVIAGLGRRPFLGIVPPANYEVLYQGDDPIYWGDPEGPRRFVVVRLHY